VLDPFIQDREGNVPDDRGLFTPSHIGMRNSRFKKVAQRTINWREFWMLLFPDWNLAFWLIVGDRALLLFPGILSHRERFVIDPIGISPASAPSERSVILSGRVDSDTLSSAWSGHITF
jgi:hypothetical protein